VQRRACEWAGERGIEDPEGRCDSELELVRPLGKAYSRAFDPVSLLRRGAGGFLMLNWMKLQSLSVARTRLGEEGASIVELSSTGAPMRQCFATSSGVSGAATGIRDGALDAQDRLALTGWIWGSGLSFGGETLDAWKRNRASYLAVLTDSQQHVFSTALGGGRNDATSVAFDAHGNVAVAGSFFGTLSFGESELSSPASMALYVAKFDPRGNPSWVHISPFSGQLVAPAVTFTDTGNVVVAGGYERQLDFGTPLPSATALEPSGCAGDRTRDRRGLRMFLIELGVSGQTVRSDSFGEPHAAASDVTTSPEGDLIVNGFFRGRLSLGGAPLEAPPSPGDCGCDIDCAFPSVRFVARWDRKRQLVFGATLPGATIVRTAPGPDGSTVVEQGIPVSFRDAWGTRMADDYHFRVEVRSPSGVPEWSRTFEKFDVKSSTTVGNDRIAVLLHDPESDLVYFALYRRKATPP
jgi:hypothetical protein